MIAQTVEAELQNYLSEHLHLPHDGKQAIIHDGYLPERDIQTGVGAVAVKVVWGVPKVRDRSGQGNKFNSLIVPPHLTWAKSLDELLPWLYLKGVSTCP